MSLLYLIAAFLLIGSAEGWAAIAPAHMSMSNFPPASSAPSSPPRAFPRPRSSRSPSSSTRAATRWDRHLDLARIAHRRKHWGQVRLLCSRVISVADDWNAVEQAHLRLALAEQKDQRVDAARRVFQEGTTACPSSDTLFMAWALMESKIKNARSRKVARALLRRAVALNPSRHSDVLRWRVFLDWKEASEAAVEAVKSALSNGQTVMTVSTVVSSPPVTAVTAVAAAVVEAGAAAATATAGAGWPAALEAQLQPSPQLAAAAGAPGTVLESCLGWSSPTAVASRAAPRQAVDLVAGWSKRWSREREDKMSNELLALCKAVEDGTTESIAAAADEGTHVSVGESTRAEAARHAGRFKELAEELERMGRGAVGVGEGGERELSGSWKLVFTTCAACDKVLTRAGSEVFQRLTPPITEIAPRASEPPVPFRCEVLLRSSPKARGASSGHGISACECLDANSSPSLTYFLRGWAHAPLAKNKRGQGERGVSLRQQVAPRSAKIVGGGGSVRGSRGGKAYGSESSGCPSSRSGCTSTRFASGPSPSPPPAVFSALGRVAKGGRGLERLATQNVTYVGGRLRIGRTRDGEVYIYERCTWPEVA